MLTLSAHTKTHDPTQSSNVQSVGFTLSCGSQIYTKPTEDEETGSEQVFKVATILYGESALHNIDVINGKH